MTLQLVRGGQALSIPQIDEYGEMLDRRERERARGVKFIERLQALPLAPTNAITDGPDQGYMWAVRTVSSTLGSAGTLTVYKVTGSPGDSTAQNDTRRLMAFLGTSQTAQAQQFPGDTFILQPGSAVLLVASTTLTDWYLQGWEVISEKQWMLA